MSQEERRRAARFPVSGEEAAVIYAASQDIPVRLVDLSATGALVSLCGLIMDESRTVRIGDEVELSMKSERSILRVSARVVRTTPQFIAMEFLDRRDGIVIDEKVRALAAKGSS